VLGQSAGGQGQGQGSGFRVRGQGQRLTAGWQDPIVKGCRKAPTSGSIGMRSFCPLQPLTYSKYENICGAAAGHQR